MASRDTVVYSVVVPVYNSAPVVTRLYGRLVTVMESLGQQFELIFIDDCSTDASWTALAEIASADRRVIAVQLALNAGQGRATLYGIGRSSGEIIVTLDDDLQHVPDDIPKLLAELYGPVAYDVVFGVPISRHHPVWRRFASWMLNLAFSLVLRKPLYLRFTGFRAFRRGTALQLSAVRCAEPFLSVLLFQITPRIAVVRVKHFNSMLGSSRYSIGKLARMTFGCLASLSDADRQNFARGACAGGVGLFTLAWSVISLSPPGLATAIIVTFGVVFGTIGLIIGSAAVVVGWRARAFQRKPAAIIVTQRVISERQGSVQ
jgi:polyisoprenyl-phosphate glycosyltransferase